MPGAFENGMPAAHHLATSRRRVTASCWSPHGLSSGNPVACDSRWRIVNFGESVVGYFSAASSGTYFSAGSSSESFPSSRSLRIAQRGEALGHRRDAKHGAAVDRRLRRDVAVAGDADVREPAVDDDAHTAPGMCSRSAYSRNTRSMSPNVDESFATRFGSLNPGFAQVRWRRRSLSRRSRSRRPLRWCSSF